MRVFSCSFHCIDWIMCDCRRESDPLWVIISGLIDRLMASDPVDVPGRNLPTDSGQISTSPHNDMSFIDYASPDHFKMLSMPNALAKPDCPFPFIPGEVLEEMAEFLNSKGYLTNYRLIILSLSGGQTKVEAIAIGNMDAIDSSQNSDMLHILCKDARVIRVQTSSLDQALLWYKKLTNLAQAKPAPNLFAMKFSKSMEGNTESWCKVASTPEYDLNEQAIFNRWGMDHDYFAVVDYNNEYAICASYPRSLIVPKGMTKGEIENLRDYRMLGRIPAVVWHCAEKNVLLLRASQPRTALMNWRNEKDEKFLRLVTEYTSKKRAEKAKKLATVPASDDSTGKIRIYDCRSYMASIGNRIKGGGSEREEHYSNMKLEYCNLPNIHNVRYTFDALRKLFNPPVEQSTFLSSLQATNWLSTIMAILMHANKAAEQLDKGRNVLIHCSDGWDRTTQLVTLVKILVDPYYRTIKGLEELIRRDWIAYGHKFSDRNGISGADTNERCPVFLQWLDALHQVHVKYPNRFEYSMAYLVKLAAHTSSSLFTSFCFNTVQEMETVLNNEGVAPFPIWRMLNSDKCYENALYEETKERLAAPDNMQTMRLWNEVYRCQEVVSLLTTTDEERRGREGREEGGGVEGGQGGGQGVRSKSEKCPKCGGVRGTNTKRVRRSMSLPVLNKSMNEKMEECRENESTAPREPPRETFPPIDLTEVLDNDGLKRVVIPPAPSREEREEGEKSESREEEDASFLFDASRAETEEVPQPPQAPGLGVWLGGMMASMVSSLSASSEEENTCICEGENTTVAAPGESLASSALNTASNALNALASQVNSLIAPSDSTENESTAPPRESSRESSPSIEMAEEAKEELDESAASDMSFLGDAENAKSEQVPQPGWGGWIGAGVGSMASMMPSLPSLVGVPSSEKEGEENYTVECTEDTIGAPGESEENTQSNGAERETTNGMERSMVKSRSSESIASTSESQIFPTAANPPLRSTESDEEGETRERRNTRTSSASGEGLASLSLQPSSTPTPSPSSSAPSETRTDLKTMLDNDGLVRFVDPTQESARKKFAVIEENASKKEERQRMRSEMSDVSIGGRDEEQFQMDDLGAQSDTSFVEENELLFTPKHNGTQVNATNCASCRHSFNFANPKTNCNSCGRAVCYRCVPHSYMETSDGVARTRKACNECYSKMHSTPTPLTPQQMTSSSTHGGSSGGRGCPDGETTPSRSPYVSPSQAVKG